MPARRMRRSSGRPLTHGSPPTNARCALRARFFCARSVESVRRASHCLPRRGQPRPRRGQMSESAARLEGGMLERRFKFAANGTTLARDTMAGVTTFIVMSYIIFVNPQILSFAGIEGLSEIGLPFNQVLAVTCLVAGVMTILMGLYTNMAYAIAPGLGLNAVIAFGLVAGEGLSFPAAMGLVVVEGIAVTILVLTGVREKIMDAIPLDLKKAIAIGIGLFIAFIGLNSAGVIVRGEGTPVDLARLTSWPIAVTFFGLVLTVLLRARGVRGDLLIGIIA